MDSCSSGTKSPRFELSGTTNIQRWRVATEHEAEDHDLGIVARATAICLRSLNFIAQHVPSSMCSKSQQRLLRRRRKTLKLWANGYSVLDGRLDITLDRSGDLRQTVLSVLSPMCKLLLKCLNSLPILQPHLSELDNLCEDAEEVYSHMQLLVADGNGSASSDESETDSEFDTDQSTAPSILFEEKVKDITVYIQCLVDLGAALECPAVADEHADHVTVRPIEERTAHDYHAELISNKYPRAHALLVQRLGQISWARFLRMQTEREKSATEREQLPERVIANTSKSLVSASEFQDSGLGASLPTKTSAYAESIASFMTSISGGERLRIPPLPTEGKTGAPFDCTACGRLVRATNDREWRKHLYADLQPYACVYTGCQYNETPFTSRKLWSDHLELGHKLGSAWEEVQCPLCLHGTGSGRSTILTHFARHMEDIALIALPPAIDSDVDSDFSIESGSEAQTIPEKGRGVASKLPQTSPLFSSAFPRYRARFYELEKNDWVDKGTALCYSDRINGEVGLSAVKEDDIEVRLVRLNPKGAYVFKRQQDTIFAWASVASTGKALSFQESHDCTQVWNFLLEATEHDEDTASNPNGNKDAGVASPQEQNSSLKKNRVPFSDPDSLVTGLVLASGKFKCSVPRCSKLRFTRQADFRRHYYYLHVADDSKFYPGIAKDDPSGAIFATSGHVYDSSDDSDKEGRIGRVLASGKIKCSDQTCSDLSFDRQVDLRRHYTNVHVPKEEHFCSHLGCSRSRKTSTYRGKSFRRKDKMEEHMILAHPKPSHCTEAIMGARAHEPMLNSNDLFLGEVTKTDEEAKLEEASDSGSATNFSSGAEAAKDVRGGRQTPVPYQGKPPHLHHGEPSQPELTATHENP